ncbi:MAG: hypothetical protein LBH43_12105 [Treponema sp.]|nr:hypothetical protein [Treponema sp.]
MHFLPLFQANIQPPNGGYWQYITIFGSLSSLKTVLHSLLKKILKIEKKSNEFAHNLWKNFQAGKQMGNSYLSTTNPTGNKCVEFRTSSDYA